MSRSLLLSVCLSVCVSIDCLTDRLSVCLLVYITSRSPADYVHGLLSHLQLCLFTQVETSSDSCMVVSGLPERNGNKHAGEIASMALRLVSYLKTFKISHMQGTTLQFRIGIHTGRYIMKQEQIMFSNLFMKETGGRLNK